MSSSIVMGGAECDKGFAATWLMNGESMVNEISLRSVVGFDSTKSSIRARPTYPMIGPGSNCYCTANSTLRPALRGSWHSFAGRQCANGGAERSTVPPRRSVGVPRAPEGRLRLRRRARRALLRHHQHGVDPPDRPRRARLEPVGSPPIRLKWRTSATFADPPRRGDCSSASNRARHYKT